MFVRYRRRDQIEKRLLPTQQPLCEGNVYSVPRINADLLSILGTFCPVCERAREFKSIVVESSIFESKNEASESLTEELCGGYLFIKAARASFLKRGGLLAAGALFSNNFNFR